MRRQQSSGGGIQMFTFLDAMVCTMGALLVLVHAFARHGTEEAIKDPEVRAARENQAAITAEIETVEWRAAQLKAARDKTAAQLADERQKLGHVEEHQRRLLAKLDELKIAAAEMDRRGAAGEQEQQQGGAELMATQARVRAAQVELDKARHSAQQNAVNYSVVPYEGPHSTRRRPIYIECQADAIVLQPEGVALTARDFPGGYFGLGNPLASAVRGISEYWARANAGGKATESYPLLLVRPEGIKSYYAARAALDSWGADFGYELIGADWELSFPEPDEQLAQMTRQVVAEAAVRMRVLVDSMPQISQAAPRQLHASASGGFVQERSPRGGGGGRRGFGGRGGGDSLGESWARGDSGDSSSPGSDGQAGGGSPRGGGSGLYAGGGAGSGRYAMGGSPNGGGPGGTDIGSANNPYANIGMGNGAYGNGTGANGNGQLGGGQNSGGANGTAGGQYGAGGGGPLGPGGGASGPAGGNGSGGALEQGTLSGQSGALGQNGAPGTQPSGQYAPGAQFAGQGGTNPGQAGSRYDGKAGSPSGGAASDGGTGMPGGAPSDSSSGRYSKGAFQAGQYGSTASGGSGGQGGNASAKPGGQPGTQPGASGGTASSSDASGAPGGSGQQSLVNAGAPNAMMNASSQQKKTSSMAKTRGRDWGLPDSSIGHAPVTRPILIECHQDRLVLISEDRRRPAKQIPLSAQTQDSMDEFVSDVWQHMRGWGTAGKGLYWRPTLLVEVKPGAADRYAEVKSLLADSGLDVHERQPQSVTRPQTRAVR
ncbi:MAG TPA: hypothetical protein VHV08_09885 [Pirellulales bacterium]|nr:hypothetical protein [Pirellulales bacterium]